MYFWFHPVCGYKRFPEWKWIEHELAFFKILHKSSLVNLAISKAFSTEYTECCSHKPVTWQQVRQEKGHPRSKPVTPEQMTPRGKTDVSIYSKNSRVGRSTICNLSLTQSINQSIRISSIHCDENNKVEKQLF